MTCELLVQRVYIIRDQIMIIVTESFDLNPAYQILSALHNTILIYSCRYKVRIIH